MISKIFSWINKRCFWGFILFVIGIVCFPRLYCQADEIVFRDKIVSNGIFLEEDRTSITLRIPKDNIESVKISHEEKKLSESDSNQINLQNREIIGLKNIEKIFSRLDRLEKELELTKKETPEFKHKKEENPLNLDHLIKAEMGSVEGEILWKSRPLSGKNVKIKLDKYTGFSLAALKKTIAGNYTDPNEKKIIFKSVTSSEGRFFFHDIPPGHYKIYWMPSEEIGWVHRFRESPDFEVLSGKLTVMNIPEKNK